MQQCSKLGCFTCTNAFVCVQQELESLREERDSLREVVERMAASGRDSMDVPTREELKHQTAALEATKAELETVRAEIEALRSGRTTAEGALDEAKELLAPEPDCVARASAAAAASGDAGNDGGGSRATSHIAHSTLRLRLTMTTSLQ